MFEEGKPGFMFLFKVLSLYFNAKDIWERCVDSMKKNTCIDSIVVFHFKEVYKKV